MFIIGEQQKRVSAGLAAEVSAKLVGMYYRSTLLSSKVLLKAGALASWNPDGWPLAQVLKEFVLPDLTPVAKVHLLGLTVRAIWRSVALQATADLVTYRLLDSIARQKGGREAIVSLRDTILDVFGLDVVRAKAARDAIIGWIAANEGRRLILP